ncbi:MAG: O-antigen ligase family protein [Chitinophagaceae bacterium]|nr:O-antigen ligase family protein [Chitinophagaceae bacterium]
MRNSPRPKNRLLKGLQGFYEENFLQKKLNTVWGYIFVTALVLVLAALTAKDMVVGIGVVAGLCGLLIGIVCISNARLGLYIIMTYSFFAFFISRLLFKGTLSVGVIFDVLVLTTFIGVLIKDSFKPDLNSFVKNALVVGVLCTLFYSGVQFFNPNSNSSETDWLAFRKFLGYVFIMFIAYNVFSSYASARNYIRFLFIICTITGLYGCIQQWHGYFDFEMQLIMADPHGFGLIFVNGEFRKYSTMSDPAAYGILMAVSGVFFLIIASDESKPFNKAVLILGSILMLLGMAYSGTRTAYATAVAGMAFYILLNFDKKSTRLFGLVAGMVLLVMLYGPFYGNKTVDRIRSTFVGAEDESYKVRVLARAFIQPYIRSHPMGGGLGTTGGMGALAQPGHYLANFQPDSSYLKRAAETGWIGLAIICIIYYIALYTGIRGFFRVKDSNIKIIYAASVTSLFAFYIAEYAQVALGQITDSVVYYPILAMILRLKYFDSTATSNTLENPLPETILSEQGSA